MNEASRIATGSDGIDSQQDRPTKMHPVDELFCWLVIKITDGQPRTPKDIHLSEVKEKLHQLYDRAFEAGQEDYQQSCKGMGGTR